MVTTTSETVTEKERRYGIGYRPITRSVPERRFTDESIFTPEKEEVVIERRISVPNKKAESATAVKVEQKPEVENITALTVKSKLMLGMYMGIAFIISVIVAITGIVLGNSTKSVAALESQVKTASAIVVTQQAQLDELSSEENITDRATANGMVNTEVDGTITLIPVGEGETYTSTTNFFDSFCDWFSSVIGG